MNKEMLEPGMYDSLVEILRQRAVHQHNKKAFTFLVDAENEELHMTYGELDLRARTIAAKLRQSDVVGECVLLLYPPGLEFICAFFGCLYAGAIAVPCYSPKMNKPNARLQTIVVDTKAKLALADTNIIGSLESRYEHAPEFKEIQWLDTSTIEPEIIDQWQVPEIDRNNVAFLQYTSGTTGTPKGVMVSHENMLHNFQLLKHHFGHHENSVLMSWVPAYHDMGLIGHLLQTVYDGLYLVLMAPAAFVQRPVRWLRAISKYRVTACMAPNFAFDVCVEKISDEQKQTLDLSCWEVAVNASEPVRERTLKNFANAFATCGFHIDRFSPSYGMAETTLFISGVKNNEKFRAFQFDTKQLSERKIENAVGNRKSRTMVGCGVPCKEMDIVIVDPETMTRCSDNQAGEVWITGKSISKGYWKQPALSEATFNAYLKDTGEGPFFRSGDLGFIHEKEVFLLSRLKDLVLIQGRSYYPQDLEMVLENCHPALEPSSVATFSEKVDGVEKLFVVQELKRTSLRKANHEEIFLNIRQAIAREFGLLVSGIALIKPMSLKKTSSGKVQRFAAKKDWFKKELKIVAEWKHVTSVFPTVEIENMNEFFMEDPEESIQNKMLDPV